MCRLSVLVFLILLTACAAPTSAPPPQTEHAELPATPTAAPTPQPPVAPPPATLTVGVSGTSFTLDDQPTFLLGVSYFDARSWRVSDLDALHAQGYNLIRIWLDWRDRSFFTDDGALHPAHTPTLLAFVDACEQRGIVVDVAILDTGLSFPKTAGTLTTAVRTTAEALADKTNVIYDLANEHNHSGDTLSQAELGTLAEVLRAADPDAIYTVSSTERYLYSEVKQKISPKKVGQLVHSPISVTVLAPHLPRTSDWWSQTGERVTTFGTYLESIGKPMPIYLQEEARRGHSGLNPSTEQFVEAVTQARDAGAAAWIFHTDAGFDLTQLSFFTQLDHVEQATMAALPQAIFDSAGR